MELITMKLSDISPYPNNPRINAKAVDTVAESIKQCTYVSPIIVDEDYVILAGHTRYKALKKLKHTEVPVIVKAGLTEEQKRKYRILDNKTNEFADWDFDLLEGELEGLDFGGFDFGFDMEDGEPATDGDEYEAMKADFERRMRDGELSDDSEEYQEFLAKFEAKKTTDDCYTPPLVYDAVADYVAKKYNLDKKNFVRPFVPNGDYQAETYKPTDVVVDNPPFSIISEIQKYYNEKGVRYFLFAPHLTLFSSSSVSACVVCGVRITYENGAVVNTSFVTNLEDCAFRSAPELYQMIKTANDENLKQTKKELPKYSYPKSVMTTAMVYAFSRYGIEFAVARTECCFIRQLDSQKERKKGIFGSGYLISDRKLAEREKAEREKAEREKAEREKAEREKAEVWELSERELAIIKSLK